MLKTIFFDCDGIVVNRKERFLQRFSRDFNVPEQKLWPFFQKEFILCKTGKSDLKEELKKYLPAWGWKKSVEDLMDYWFKGESTLDQTALDYIQSLRAQGVRCYLSTNNEKYRSLYLLHKLKLGEMFDEFFTSAHVGHLKVEPEFWGKIYKFEMGNKREILVVDDSKEIIETARKFGFYGHYYTSLEDLTSAIDELMKV